MIATWAVAYLCAWLVTTIAAFVAARHLGERRLGWASTLALSVLAGAVWPLLVIGAIELAAVAALSKVMKRNATHEATDEANTSSDAVKFG